MTRQAQNMVLGGLAFAVGIVAMIAVFLLMMDDQSNTTAGAPAAPLTEAEGLTDASGDGSLTAPSGESTATTAALKPLAVLESPATVAEPLITTSTVAATTTTAAPTTKPPTTVESTTTTETVPETTTTTVGSDTSMTDSTEATTTTTESGGDETTTSTATETSQDTTTTTVDTTPDPTQPPSTGGLNDVEREIARLTNELRTNPNGSLKREGAVIDCGGRIRVSNGQYEPINALQISEVASVQVARPWSAQMTRSNFEHQPNAGVPALQAVGIEVRSAGENIAYHSYSDKAWVHFRGWRESDGHFCNMMDPGFTHLGVGEVSKNDGISYATQNFYSTR